MRLRTLGAFALVGCNSIFGIHDLPPADAVGACGDACACAGDTDCGDHMYCDIAATSSACRCVAGYTGTDACTWSGVVADPGFQTTSTWTLGSGTTIDTASTGNGVLDPGLATASGAMLGSDAESVSAEVSQPYVMPRLSRAEPLAIELSAAAITGGTGMLVATELGVGDGWNFYPLPFPIETSMDANLGPQFSVTRTCLGEAQYAPESSTGSGVSQTLDLVAAIESFQIDELRSSSIELDHLEIVEPVAGECPAPGTVPNGDAEGSDGWTFHTTPYTSGDGASAGYASGVGVGSSRGVELAGSESCDEEQAFLPMSIPLPNGSAATAMSVYHKHNGGQFQMLISDSILELGADSAGVTDTWCLPAPIQGVYTELSAVAASSDTCGTPVTQVADIDEVAVASDPRCPIANGLVDPSFESGYQLTDASTLGTAAIEVVDDGTAPDGSSYLKLTTSATCDEGEWVAEVATPAGAASGEAVAFQYEVSAPNALSVTSGSNTTVLPQTLWTSAKTCLAPLPAGQLQAVAFLMRDQSQSTCNIAETMTAGIDALAVVDDPSCAP